ncbi:hypothetical protein SCWH03_14260 [Streptomyces pacificus]|uniref:Uncharacterized protein n=1 Tax=Streptomyces pacificus TaxID=2705029 RepID=A0A6A0AS50_9ACTN|nr:hypothetical protein SCWH03_14260 [Streptomyces pacificus]
MTATLSTAQAIAHPGRSASAKTAVPETAHSSPQTLSQNRIRSGVRAVAGSLPVRMGLVPFPSSIHPDRGDR